MEYIEEVIMFKHKEVKIPLFIITLIFSILFIYAKYSKINNSTINVKYIDSSSFNSIIKEAFLTDKGYSETLSQYMPYEVFRKTNIYHTYALEYYEGPFQIDLDLDEVSQSYSNELISIKVTHSIIIKDSKDNLAGGSRAPITFTVQEKNNSWYIIECSQPA